MQPLNAHEIDLRKIKLPWGTFSEVARRMDLKRNTVRDGWRRQSPKYVDAVLEYLENRKETNRQIIARALRATDKK